MSVFSTHPPLGPDDLARKVSALTRRVENVELLVRGPDGGGTYFELVLEFNGGLFTNQETLRYPFGRPGSVTGYRFTGDTAASTSTSIQIIKSGSVAETITVAASTQLLSSTELAIGFAAGDWVQGKVSSPGTGGAGFCVVLECVE